MKISKKKHLEMVLEKVPRHPNPKVELEQYSTPAPIAADLLWNAGSLGDIGGRNVLDIGCGCGILAIGSSLMNSNFSMGVDVDGESIEMARKTQNDLLIDNLDFAVGDIDEFDDIYISNCKIQIIYEQIIWILQLEILMNLMISMSF